MNIYKDFQAELAETLAALVVRGDVPADAPLERATVEPPRDPAHGDLATNAAMVLARASRCKPRDLAEKLAADLRKDSRIETVEIAGPGFINLRLVPSIWQNQLRVILKNGISYGDSELGTGQSVNVEYVSANPTGPLHAAHARGAVIGDALAALLEKAGYTVIREYYINDAGTQVDILARSSYLRYREALGEDIGEIPAGFYPGDYLKEVGEALAKRDGDKWLAADEADWLPVIREEAVARMTVGIREDLKSLGIQQDVFTSERKLVESGKVADCIQALEDQNLLYVGVLEPPKGKIPQDWEARPQTLFRSSDFGDDVDRPIKKSDGCWTYFASDIAYHLDKYERGCSLLIDVWGADHGGYVKRMQSAVQAITGGKGSLDVKLCQLVHMMDNGKAVRMSKRAGTFITLRDVIDQVGRDVVRFIMLTRRNDQTLEFDFTKVTEQSRDNPVFYVQYAHARCCSVLRHAAGMFAGLDLNAAALAGADITLLTAPAELELIKKLVEWPRQVEAAALAHEPHRIAFYLGEVASLFHALWNQGRDHAELRFLRDDQPELSRARLALLKSVCVVIDSGLKVMGVEPVEEMR